MCVWGVGAEGGEVGGKMTDKTFEAQKSLLNIIPEKNEIKTQNYFIYSIIVNSLLSFPPTNLPLATIDLSFISKMKMCIYTKPIHSGP